MTQSHVFVKARILLWMLLATMFCLTSCNDDKFLADDYEEGLPATLSVRLFVPHNVELMNSRAIDPEAESQIKELVLIGFEKGSNRKIEINLTGKLEAQEPSPTAGRLYNLSEPVDTKSGVYRLYAIANWSSSFSGLSYTEISRMSEAELRSLRFANGSLTSQLSGNGTLPMSCYIDNFEIKPGENTIGEASANGIVLTRANLRIEFEFVNGVFKDNDGNNSSLQPNFTAKSFTVYNVPVYAAAFPSENSSLIGGTDVFSIDSVSIVDGKSFSFLMLENNQTGMRAAQGKTAPTTQADREAWDHTAGLEMVSRLFTSAPSTSTYVVVSGDYTGPAAKDKPNEVYNGSVRFVIHLGDFDSSKAGWTYDNFNVLRNECQKYTVTVNGANSIIANVTVNGTSGVNPGYEGNIYASHRLNLDAHYSKVMIRMPRRNVELKSDDGSPLLDPDGNELRPTILLATPQNGFARQLLDLEDLKTQESTRSRAAADVDYKWIQFMKPVNENTFPQYDGVGDDGEPKDRSKLGYVTDLAANPENYCILSADGQYYYTAAFIDENIYTHDATMRQSQWGGYAVNDRVMIFNPETRLVSDNLQNVLGPSTGFYISQRPVLSSYDLSIVPHGNNPFGFEQVEEPSGCPLGGLYSTALSWNSSQTNLSAATYSESNGQASTAAYFPNITTSGGFYRANASGDYEFYNPSGASYNVTEAIASRNRDLNGDGRIDGDELRWYMPTMTQYLILWFARNNIPDQFKLYDKTMADKYEFSQYYQPIFTAFPRYMTSSASQYLRGYLHDRSAFVPHELLIETGKTFNPYQKVRFVRNLGITAHQANGRSEVVNDISRLSQHDPSTRTIRMRNAYAARAYSWTGAYPMHNQFDEANEAPLVLEYMDNCLDLNLASGWNKVSREASLSALNAAAVAAYNAKFGTNHTELPDGWRVPNNRELMLLYVNGLIEQAQNPDGTLIRVGPFLSCTFLYGSGYSIDLTPTQLIYSGTWVGDLALGELLNNSWAINHTWLVRDAE